MLQFGKDGMMLLLLPFNNYSSIRAFAGYKVFLLIHN